MGSLFIDSSTKGFTGLSAKDAVTADPRRVNSAIAEVLDALDGTEPGQAVEIVIAVSGKNPKIFTVNVENSSEVREMLQWTIGRD